jgi:hypothetical protein
MEGRDFLIICILIEVGAVIEYLCQVEVGIVIITSLLGAIYGVMAMIVKVYYPGMYYYK